MRIRASFAASMLVGITLLAPLVLGSVAGASPSKSAQRLCGAGPGITLGTVADPQLEELSGLVQSQAHPGVLWAHNDSGDEARVFALQTDGASLGTVRVSGATAVDWEDLALGPGPDGQDNLFVGDIGDNAANRTGITVYRFPEPTPPGAGATSTVAGQALALRYPDGPHDAEALMVDARSGDLVIVTKVSGAPAGVYRGPGAANAAAGSTTTLERVGNLAAAPDAGLAQRIAQLGGGSLADLVTAADANARVGVAAVRTYGWIAVYRWTKRQSLATALLSPPCSAPAPADLRFPQGEAIALAPDGRSYITASEGVGPPLVEFRATR